ncbi:hypothetical protein [Edaphobacter aggregans]|uniref:hypothetical protein n=1 Tax=Edaphobacter aggregans TaxID=570835 RepID=UPI0005563F20|nr:hypothetical protein [Edaphobacter aggregans]
MWHRAGGLVLAGWVGIAVVLGAVESRAQGAPSGDVPSAGGTAEEILARMAARNLERQTLLERYTSERVYRVEYKGTGGEHRAEIEVHAEYTAPGTKHLTVVSESGSKVMCERVLRRLVVSEEESSDKANRMQTALSTANYAVELEGEETVDGVRAWVLRVTPKVDNRFTYRGRVWVSEEDYGLVRVVGEPAKNPSWWINRASFEARYVRDEGFWLPERNVSVSHVRIGGEARLTIEYGVYHIVSSHVEGPTQTALLRGR